MTLVTASSKPQSDGGLTGASVDRECVLMMGYSMVLRNIRDLDPSLIPTYEMVLGYVKFLKGESTPDGMASVSKVDLEKILHSQYPNLRLPNEQPNLLPYVLSKLAACGFSCQPSNSDVLLTSAIETIRNWLSHCGQRDLEVPVETVRLFLENCPRRPAHEPSPAPVSPHVQDKVVPPQSVFIPPVRKEAFNGQALEQTLMPLIRDGLERAKELLAPYGKPVPTVTMVARTVALSEQYQHIVGHTKIDRTRALYRCAKSIMKGTDSAPTELPIFEQVVQSEAFLDAVRDKSRKSGYNLKRASLLLRRLGFTQKIISEYLTQLRHTVPAPQKCSREDTPVEPSHSSDPELAPKDGASPGDPRAIPIAARSPTPTSDVSRMSNSERDDALRLTRSALAEARPRLLEIWRRIEPLARRIADSDIPLTTERSRALNADTSHLYGTLYPLVSRLQLCLPSFVLPPLNILNQNYGSQCATPFPLVYVPLFILARVELAVELLASGSEQPPRDSSKGAESHLIAKRTFGFRPDEPEHAVFLRDGHPFFGLLHLLRWASQCRPLSKRTALEVLRLLRSGSCTTGQIETWQILHTLAREIKEG